MKRIYKTMMDGTRVIWKQLECKKCGYSWTYKGSKLDWTNCPRCKAHVNTEELINEASECKQCGSKEDLVIHRKYKNDKLKVGDVVCRRCDIGHHMGYELCSVCKKRYKHPSYPTCYACAAKRKTRNSFFLCKPKNAL